MQLPRFVGSKIPADEDAKRFVSKTFMNQKDLELG